MNSIEGVVRKLLFLFVAILSTIVFQPTALAITSSTPVELTVPQTILRVQGLAAPNALVTIKESGSVIVSTTANSLGVFSADVTRSSGLHTIIVEYQDVNGSKSLSNTQTVSVQPQKITNVDVFLSPTLTRGSSGIVLVGSVVQLRGYTVPESIVSLRVDYNSFVFDTVSDVNGFYEFLIDSSLLGEGKRTVNVITTRGASISDTSRNIVFEVQSASGPSNPDIIVAPSQLPPPVPQSPNDGAIIAGDRVTITGDSVPNAQINIYENGQRIGSVFSNQFGRWSFEYIATTSPVTLSFEACISGSCSVLSKTLTLIFNGIKTSCRVEISLEEYRFFGAKKKNGIRLSIDKISENSIVEINWGDGTIERFDYNNTKDFEHSYYSSGNFNGSITVSDKVGSDCKQVRYFSVLVTEDDKNNYFNSFLILFFILAGLLFVGFIVAKDKQNSVQKH